MSNVSFSSLKDVEEYKLEYKKRLENKLAELYEKPQALKKEVLSNV